MTIKKSNIFRVMLILIFTSLLSTPACKKDKTPVVKEKEIKETEKDPVLPTLETSNISKIEPNTAIGGGKITSDGGAKITQRGICWGLTSNPTTLDSHTIDGFDIGYYSSKLHSLEPGKTYYVRAYAINSVGTAYGAEKSFTASMDLKPGVIYEGGMILYLDSTGLHGLVVTTYDIGTFNKWGCKGNSIPGASGTAIGTGQLNTNEILGLCNLHGIAAKICDNLDLNGKTDWFLPSIDELELFWTNLNSKGLGNFTSGGYWSSSEESKDQARTIVIQTGNVQNGSKDNPYKVRAVRKF